MQNDPYLLIEQVKNSSSWDQLPSLIDELVNLKGAAVKVLLEQPPGLVTSRLAYFKSHVFARVGYPTNEAALAYIVSDASNPNSPIWEVSRDALLAIGAPVLPIISDAIEYYRRDEVNSTLEIGTLKEIDSLICKQISQS